MNYINSDKGCIGCTACYSICPRRAIVMGQDKDGFYVPFVDHDKCIECRSCIKICPLLEKLKSRKKDETISRYMFAKDVKERIKSCSGGVFYVLAKKVLAENGVVCGCIWTDRFVAEHVCTDKLEVIKKMRGSKYVQSNMKDCFTEIKNHILSGKKVLFSGTGCQTTALKKYIGKNGENLLICCAVICGGVPSPKIWDLYRKSIEDYKGSKLIHLDMRNKEHGWLMPEIYAEFANGDKLREVLLHQNLYGTNFGEGLFLNEECMECKFKLNNINADVLLSDDWGINRERLKESQNMGSSAVVSLTQGGEHILSDITDAFVVHAGDIDDIIASHHVLTQNHIKNPERKTFFEQVNSKNIIELLTLYKKRWDKRVAMPLYVKMLYKFKIYTPLYNLKWKLKNRK